MAKQKLSELQRSNVVNSSDIFYFVQSSTSKSVNAGSLFASFSTANVREAAANLYFTNSRARAAISVAGSATYDPVSGVLLVSSVAQEYVSNINGANGQVILSTANIAEVGNLYYTNARVYANIAPLLTTANVVEINNLYFSNLRVYSNVIGLLDLKANVSDLNTSNIIEGNNLYFTNTRVYANISPLLTTANISEVNNLYFTNARVYANVVGLLDSKANVSDLTTSNIAEGNNLYYTNVKAILAAIPATTQLVVSTPVFNYNLDQYNGDNPTIHVSAGETISFNLTQSASHPLAIRVSNGGSNYNTGLTHIATDGTISTGSSAQGKVSGKLFWKIPNELGGNTYVYQCTNHASMVGNIIIQSKSLVRLGSYSQSELNAYVAGTGDIVYNTTNNKFQGYTTSGWVDLH